MCIEKNKEQSKKRLSLWKASPAFSKGTHNDSIVNSAEMFVNGMLSVE